MAALMPAHRLSAAAGMEYASPCPGKLTNPIVPTVEKSGIEFKLEGPQRAGPAAGVLAACLGLIKAVQRAHERERARLRAEIARVPGLFALLMKPRNGGRWSKEERAELRQQLRGLSRLSLYLIVLAVPGTTIALPLLALWLDRRSHNRLAGATPKP